MPESGTSGSVRDRDGKPPGPLDLRCYRKAITTVALPPGLPWAVRSMILSSRAPSPRRRRACLCGPLGDL